MIDDFIKENFWIIMAVLCIIGGISSKVEPILTRKKNAWVARKRREHPRIAGFFSFLRKMGKVLFCIGCVLAVIMLCAVLFSVLGPLILMVVILIAGLCLARPLGRALFPGPSKYELESRQEMRERCARWQQEAEQKQKQKDAYRREAEQLESQACWAEDYARRTGSQDDAARARQLRYKANEARKKTY